MGARVVASSTRMPVSVCIFLQLCAQIEAASFLRAGQVSQQDAERTLAAELAGGIGEGRLHELEQALSATFASLPKDAEGHLGHQAVRYVLHRLFVQRHGWLIKGLDPADEAANATSRPAGAPVRGLEWVATYLQDKMEETLGGKGAGLRELATLAATLEDLVRQEATDRLRTAYEIHQLNTTSNITEEQMDDVIRTFFTAFLIANNFSASDAHEARLKKERFAQIYTGYQEAEQWIAELVGPKNGRDVDFHSSSNVAIAIGERYHVRNDLECKSLKSTLLELEGSKPGRVSLADFYRAGKHGHWKFAERPEYLKLLGALDDSDTDKPQVIVPNYVMGRINCLEVSSIYALCCQNECEDLMAQLEREIGAPEADVSTLASIAGRLSTDTVQAPRQLSEGLRERLAQVAESNGGRVPLHGRLFAQWMHHAFPRECPYPHEAGSTSALTPEEWMDATASSASATDEEIEHFCSAAEFASGARDAPKEEELPWSHTEEILVKPEPHLGAEATLAARSATGCMNVASGVAGLLILALLALDASRQQTRDCRSRGVLDGEESCWGGAALTSHWLRAPLTVAALTLLAFAAGLLDATFMLWTIGGPLAFRGYQLASRKLVVDTAPRSKKI